jgi:flagellar capping protein FliD
MSLKLLKVIIPIALALLLVACTATPVRNVDNAPINVSSSNYDLTDVTKAIQRAGTGLGWQMKEETPGHIVGRLYLRSHVAIVDITYTLDDFSINYKDSTNLNYDPAANTIHKNYNGWIQNLTNAINAQLVGI